MMKAGQDRNPALVIAVLIGIPRIPAAAKVTAVGESRRHIGLRHDEGLRVRDVDQRKPCEGDHD
jgi:hypothetical protein